MRRMPPCGMLALAAAALLTIGRTAPAADDVPTARVLPPNVYAFVTIPDINELKSRWNKSSFGELRDDRELAEFWGELEKQFAELSKQLEEKTGVTLEELTELPDGEVSFAFVQPSGKKPAIVGLMNFGDNRETLDKLLEKGAEELKEQGATRATTEFEDTTIVVWTKKPAEDAEGEDAPAGRAAKKEQVAYFIKDSTIVGSSDPAALEAILVRWDGEHEQTFADNEPYQYILERTKNDSAEAVLNWYVNPIGALRAVLSTQGEGNFQAQMILGFLPALGLSELKAIGGSMDMATSKYDSVSRTFAYVEFPTSGVLNVFQFPPVEQTPPAWVPADASTYYQANWDVVGAYGAVETLVDSFRGPGSFSAMVDQLGQSEDGPKVHPKKDFIDLLSGRIDILMKAPQEADEDDELPESDRFLIALGLKDAAKMQGVLSKIAKTPGFPGKTRDFRGATIYELSTGGALQNAGNTMGVAVSNGGLMLASDVLLLEQVLRSDADQASLAQSAEWKRVAQHFPAKTSLIGFQQQDSQAKTAYELLRSGQGDQLFGETKIDFTKLPPFEAIAKYMPPTGSYAVPDEKGVHFVSFSLPVKK